MFVQLILNHLNPQIMTSFNHNPCLHCKKAHRSSLVANNKTLMLVCLPLIFYGFQSKST